MEYLEKWKDKKNRKPLIIRGARQVGKTWLMKEFARRYFEKVAYINFDNNPRMKSVFENDYDISRIIMALQIEAGMRIDAGNTLIIFDEVQEVPKALASLKYFYENASDYAILSAGSMLGVAMHQGVSFPVGKVEYMDLFPLNFKEFLSATGNGPLKELLSMENIELITSFKDKYIELLKRYFFLGGMPEIVKTFISEHDFESVSQIKKNLLDLYEMDFSKHAPKEIVPRIRMVWNSIPAQLAKENRKFMYGHIREGARAKDFELAIQWLQDCGLIHKVFRITKPGLPLKAAVDFRAFKIYLFDIGLLSAMVNLSPRVLIDGDRVFEEFKGAITEQYILQQLISELKLEPYYYTADKSSGEIDFLIQKGSNIIPIEVKASENLQSKSLKAYSDKYVPKFSVRTSLSNFRKESWLINIPLYAFSLVENIERLLL
jgi:predicted AAA+ superfamily ATPase